MSAIQAVMATAIGVVIISNCNQDVIYDRYLTQPYDKELPF